MQLVEQGKLGLDSVIEVERLCPKSKGVKNLREDGTCECCSLCCLWKVVSKWVLGKVV